MVLDGVPGEAVTLPRASDEERRARWVEWLVRDPQGWDEATRQPGSIRYSENEVEALKEELHIDLSPTRTRTRSTTRHP